MILLNHRFVEIAGSFLLIKCYKSRNCKNHKYNKSISKKQDDGKQESDGKSYYNCGFIDFRMKSIDMLSGHGITKFTALDNFIIAKLHEQIMSIR